MKKLRQCECCGEMKMATQFTYSSHVLIKKCKECNEWLRLFAEVFGPVKDAEYKRKASLKSYHKRRAQKLGIPYYTPKDLHPLYGAFGIRTGNELQSKR